MSRRILLSGPERLAMLATEYAGCSAHVDQDRYVDVVVRLADRQGDRLEHFVGQHPPSSDVLFALGLYRLAGLSEGLLSVPYRCGLAGMQLTTFAHGRSAWVDAAAACPFLTGDVWVVVGPPSGIHVGVCVSDARPTDDGSWVVDTVEGGQLEDVAGWFANLSAIRAFNGAEARRFVWRDGALYLGRRVLHGVICADALGVLPIYADEPDEAPDPPDLAPEEAAPEPARPPRDAASIAAARELPIAPVDETIATVRVRKRPRGPKEAGS
jgi:hypothetical protein